MSDNPVTAEPETAASEPTATGPAATETNPSESSRSESRKVRDGIVVSNKMDKTVVVKVTRRSRHPQYGKTVQQSKRYYAHDEENTLNEGDQVRIVETRPLSAKKRWRLLEILERAR